MKSVVSFSSVLCLDDREDENGNPLTAREIDGSALRRVEGRSCVMEDCGDSSDI